MVEYTIDDIRGPTVAREMAQLKEFVLAKFNGAIADAEAAAAAAATAAANAVLANTVKKTGEASQSIAGNVGVTGTLDAAAIGSGSTPIVCGNLTAFGDVSLDDTVLQGNLSGADSSALINLSGVGSVLVPTPTSNGEAATKKYVDDQDALKISITDINNYAVGLTGNQGPIAGNKTFTGTIVVEGGKFSNNLRAKNTVDDVTEVTPVTERQTALQFVDKNNALLAAIAINHLITGEKQFAVYIYDKNGGSHKTVLATYKDS